MRVRALSLLVTVVMLVPTAALAAGSVGNSSETTPVTSSQRQRPPARSTVVTSAGLADSATLAGSAVQEEQTVEPDPAVPIGRWFGCRPPFGGLCVQDRVAARTVSDLVPARFASVDDWRPLAETFFAPGDVTQALKVIDCESGGDPNAKNRYSSASGLFQHLGTFWGERSESAGYAGSDIFDPLANVAVAAWLVYDGGGWSHWEASRSCWG